MTGAVVVANAAVDETYAIEAQPCAGQSLIGRFCQRDVGGKGANVATLLARTGLATTLMAAIGDDERGRFLQATLGLEPVTLALSVLAGLPTDLSLVYRTPDGDNAIVTTVETTRALPTEAALTIIRRCQPRDFLVLQGNLTRDMTLALVAAAQRARLRIVLNPSPTVAWVEEILQHVHILFLNAGEAMTLVGTSEAPAVTALLNRGVNEVVLTTGAEGAWLGVRNTATEYTPINVPAKTVTVVDTTGAGDTYMAVALASAARRGTSLDALALAHAGQAAAITIGRHGTLAAFPDVVELDALLHTNTTG